MPSDLRTDRRWLGACAAVALAAALLAHAVERDFGRVAIEFVGIPDPSGALLAGKLYRPQAATGQRQPGVLALHGYQNDKETQDSFAIELARRGFVVLAIDHLGHGDSGGSLDFRAFVTDPLFTIGAGAGYQYLKRLPFVDSGRLGIIGHSMGAMTAVKVAFLNPDHRAINSQCGPSGDRRLHNLLVTQAQFEEFRSFREGEPRVERLTTSSKRLVAFGLTGPVQWDTTYGSMDDGSARRAALVWTVHAGVTHSPNAVTETVEWMRRTLKAPGQDDAIPSRQHIYLWKELCTLIALLATLFSIIPLTNLLLASPLLAEIAQPLPARYIASGRSWWRLATLNALIGGVTFPVLTHLNSSLSGVPGFVLPMGNGVLIWFLGNALICLVLFALWFRNVNRNEDVSLHDLGATLGQNGAFFDARVLGKTLLAGTLIVGWMCALEALSERTLGIEFRFIWPFMRQFSLRRFGLFWLYVVPAVLFFLLNGGLFLFGQARQPDSSSPGRTLWRWWMKNLYAGLFGLCLVWAIQYVPYLWLGQPPGFEAIGLPQYAEMWPLMLFVFLPTFAVLLLFLTWFFLRTGRIYLGAVVIASLTIWFTTAGSVIGR